MSGMTLFQNNPLANSDLFKSLQAMTDNLVGSGGSGRRISIKGGRFRMMVGGEQVSVSKNNELNVVIVNAAPMARTYYVGTYDPEKTSAPTCWSNDTQTPAADVPAEDRLSARCADCPMNIKGSGQGDSRACRFSQRLAVTLEGAPEEVYQMQIPATSIFGDGKGGDLGMQAYARLLKAHNTPPIAVITEMRFDENSETPKLFFKPVRPLDADELNTAVAMKDSDDALRAITMTVSKTDDVAPKVAEDKPKAAPKKAAPKVAEPEDDEDEEPVIKTAKKSVAPKETAGNLDAILSDWDDE
jgi:hypothetical protein